MDTLEIIKYYHLNGLNKQHPQLYPQDYSHLVGMDIYFGFKMLRAPIFEGSFFIMGTGGQIIFVSPKHKLLIATHSHLYPENAIDHENKLFYAIWDYLIPIFKLEGF